MESEKVKLPKPLQQVLLSLLNASSPLAMIDPLRKIWKALDNDEYKILLGKPSVKFIPFLVHTVLNCASTLAVRAALGCLWYLSRANENRTFIASAELGLIPFLVNVVRNDNLAFKEFSMNILMNCSLDPANHDYLLSDSVGFLSYCSDFIRSTRARSTAHDEQIDIDPFSAVSNVCTHIEKKNFHYLIQHRLHEMVLQKILTYGGDVSSWEDRVGGPEYWLLNTLVDLTKYEEGARAIVEIPWFREKASAFFIALLPSKMMEALKALCIMTQLSMVYEEYGVYLSKLALIHPDLIELFNEVFSATLDGDERLQEIDFVFGLLSLKVITKTIRILCSLSKENCECFARQERAYQNLLKIVDLYIEDAPEVSARLDSVVEFAGGGGKDEETLCNVLEIWYIYINQFAGLKPSLSNSFITRNKNIQRIIKRKLKVENSSSQITLQKSLILCELIQEENW